MARLTTYKKDGLWAWLLEDYGLFWTIFFLGFLAGATFTLVLLFIILNLFIPAFIKAIAIGALG